MVEFHLKLSAVLIYVALRTFKDFLSPKMICEMSVKEIKTTKHILGVKLFNHQVSSSMTPSGIRQVSIQIIHLLTMVEFRWYRFRVYRETDVATQHDAPRSIRGFVVICQMHL